MSLIGDAGGKFGGGGKDDDLKSLKNGFFVTAGGLGSQDGLVSLNNKVQVPSENNFSDDEGEEEDEYQSRRSSSTRVSAALKDREVVGGSGKKTKGVKKTKTIKTKIRKIKKKTRRPRRRTPRTLPPLGILIFHRMPN